MYWGTKCWGNYTAEVIYSGYRPTYHILCSIYVVWWVCNRWTLPENVCLKTLPEMTPFLPKSLNHVRIWNHLAMLKVLGLCKHITHCVCVNCMYVCTYASFIMLKSMAGWNVLLCVCSFIAPQQENLGVSKKPDVISTWSGPLDSEAQDSIHSDCVRVAGERMHRVTL